MNLTANFLDRKILDVSGTAAAQATWKPEIGSRIFSVAIRRLTYKAKEGEKSEEEKIVPQFEEYMVNSVSRAKIELSKSIKSRRPSREKKVTVRSTTRR